MNLNFHKRKSDRCRGSALAELALSLPFFLFLGFGSYDAMRIIKTRQSMQSHAREIGAIAFRQCALQSESATDACLAGLWETSYLTYTLPEARVVLSVYKFDPTQPPSSNAARVGLWTSNAQTTTRITLDLASSFESLNADNQRILIVELQVPFSTTSQVVGAVFPNAELYEALLF